MDQAAGSAIEIGAFVRSTLASLGLTLLRYGVFSGGAFFFFWIWKREAWKRFRIQKGGPVKSEQLREIKWSLSTMGIQAVLTTATMYLVARGHSPMYREVAERGWPYFFVSMGIMIVMLEIYFYFSHRLLHLRGWFERVHYVHHLSRDPSPLSSLSFHPIEAVIQWLAFPMIAFTIPWHPVAMGLFLLFTFFVNIIGHSGYEMYPRSYIRNAFWKWGNTSTFHNMHHTHRDCNFGLYSNFLDRVYRTVHADYERYFDSIRERAERGGALPDALPQET